MRVAVLGASGMLGSMLVDYLSPRFDVTGTTRRDFDALNPDWQALEGFDWIINAIGIIPQRHKGEDAKNLMFYVNSCLPGQIRTHSRARVIQIATDCVWSGKRGNYTEVDKHDWSSSFTEAERTYGFTKHMGEYHGRNFYNLRCSVVGREPEGNYSLLKWFLSQPQGATVDGYFNQWWNGITTLQFARICEGVINAEPQFPHVQHIVPADSCSKGMLLEIFKEVFGRSDIIIRMKQTERRDRRLATVNLANNALLWNLAGYGHIPTIKEMVRELAEYVKARREVLSSALR